MTIEQFQVLRRIRLGIDLVSALADANHTSRSSVSKAVDALVTRSVSRLTDEIDRRHVHLTLTTEGERLLRKSTIRLKPGCATKFGALSPDSLRSSRRMPCFKRPSTRPGEGYGSIANLSMNNPLFRLRFVVKPYLLQLSLSMLNLLALTGLGPVRAAHHPRGY